MISIRGSNLSGDSTRTVVVPKLNEDTRGEIKVSGRKTTVTDALRAHVDEKIGEALKVFDIEPMTADVAVSYTHLDVYKRQGVTRALDAVSSAEARIARNVTPQLAIEVMLFDIRKALQCP